MQRTRESEKVAKWREKAKVHRLEKERLNRRNKELLISRDRWKGKYQALRRVQKSGPVIEAPPMSSPSSARPSGYRYSVFLIGLCLWIRQQGNCSLRTCAQVVRRLCIQLQLDCSGPCVRSIQLWEQKMGYYCLHESWDGPQDWAVLVDESISMGQSKLLLILGVNLSRYSFQAPLTHSDVEVLDLAVARSWKGEEIASRLAAVQRRGYRISYGITDEGNNLRKAFNEAALRRISDCTHAISKAVEKCYKNQAGFVSFSREVVAFKRKVVLSSLHPLTPPTQRSKARFLNLHSLSQWADQALRSYRGSNQQAEIKEALSWIEPHTELIEELSRVCKTMRELFKVLKNQGLNPCTADQCFEILHKRKTPNKFQQHVEAYLRENLAKIEQENALIACSDVIESIFGKFKARQAHNPYQGIMVGCLTIPNFKQEFPPEKIKQAMEKTTCKDIERWKITDGRQEKTNPKSNELFRRKTA